ncbi:hypothetical protein AAFF_G00291090 [Aldrovandia affinis]|uniref:Uncharacterized protein n=1 Tax=Aldrovandia affinis TaxID=143900 RepID=A0AAD7R975_9TELE|nr:hypothetical protein AAFF_G00291090 [Aldrovandia affinis]
MFQLQPIRDGRSTVGAWFAWASVDGRIKSLRLMSAADSCEWWRCLALKPSGLGGETRRAELCPPGPRLPPLTEAPALRLAEH